MAIRGHREFKRPAHLVKGRYITVRVPNVHQPLILEKLKTMGFKKFQQVCDAILISGIVYRRPEVLDFIAARRGPYEKLRAEELKSRLGLVEKPTGMISTKNRHTYKIHMYEADYVAYKQYLVEVNIAEQVLFDIMLDGFLEDCEAVLQVIRQSQELEISKRKKIIARLTNDEYIETLPILEAQQLLEQLTHDYDNREFGESVIEQIQKLYSEKIAEAESDAEIEDAFAKQIESVRKSKGWHMNDAIKPRKLKGTDDEST